MKNSVTLFCGFLANGTTPTYPLPPADGTMHNSLEQIDTITPGGLLRVKKEERENPEDLSFASFFLISAKNHPLALLQSTEI